MNFSTILLNLIYMVLTVIELLVSIYLYMKPEIMYKNIPGVLIVSSCLLILYPILYLLTFTKFHIKNELSDTIMGFRKYVLLNTLFVTMIIGYYRVFEQDCDEYGREYCAKYSDPKNIEIIFPMLICGTLGYIFSHMMYNNISYKYEKYSNEKYSKSVLSRIKRHQKRVKKIKRKKLKKILEKKKLKKLLEENKKLEIVIENK
jgi:hypothetical protein